MPSVDAPAQPPPPPAGARVFISYAHEDDDLRAGLRAHLAALEREGLVRAWDDRQILAGDAWADEIDARLNEADVILMLVSADFIQSQYCYGKELARALERHEDKADRAIVIPVILRQCVWQNTVFKDLQALPTDGRPLDDWKTPDAYYTSVTQGLRQRLLRAVDDNSTLVERLRRRLRDPRWWQQPRIWVSTLALLASTAAAGTWWRSAAVAVDATVATALQHLRSGRAANAVEILQPPCQGWVSRDACFVLDKARLAARLEQPDDAALEPLASQAKALRAAAPDDPDLLLIDAQLRLRSTDLALHPQARADIDRAIARADGQLPEAHFVLANLEMLAGRFAQALPLLDKALDPQLNRVAPAHYLNARAYARARTGDLHGALTDYQQSAEAGLILSRVEMAEWLWALSEFDRASDQLQAAQRALAVANQPLPGRNALPWVLESPAGAVVLKLADEKRCYVRWMHQAGLALAGRPAPAAAPDWDGCGPETTHIAAAVAAALARAAGAGMSDAGRAVAADFARQHRLR